MDKDEAIEAIVINTITFLLNEALLNTTDN
jgi:hypothetical protein